ncbi:hypothetical protein W02_11270 [Nitrospira sp. KM1]|uniref:IPT/TIG domain-containing protein n=1 Tax=Nitrospira sp. KM1 TaxID=1936990 RepID=UPI0013A7B252|nr:IPT/TIG domain-containing protein [Nitrospira sp. KM1]BCA53987.1 hypothetical protein W02_11270 [Nitrospira sp. KM1]
MKRQLGITAASISAAVFLLCAGLSWPALGAENAPPAKKKAKAPPEAKTPQSKSQKPAYQTAELAGKAKACFGAAPKIEKLVPDEGKAGDKITIKGSQFGSANCLRDVSFGPGRPAKFTMQDERTITTTVPSGGRKGMAIVSITTASGGDSKAFLLK